MDNVMFPDVLLCAGKTRLRKWDALFLDSMHSKMQLERKYPNVDIDMIYKLYGLNVDPALKSMWDYKGNHFQASYMQSAGCKEAALQIKTG